MNWPHLKAFFWLRWRLMVNHSRRAGTLNGVLMTIAMVGAVAMTIPLFLASFLLGIYLIPEADSWDLLYAWDILLFWFLLLWGIGVVVELQRTDALSLAKFLHLPVSVEGVFLINYLSSLFRLSLIFFGPLMIGFCLALIVARGILLLPILPLLAAFLLMITALTYQLQGWLGALMENPRRRRTVVMVVTIIFVLAFQLPGLLEYVAPGGARQHRDQSAVLKQDLAKLDRDRRTGKIDSATHLRGYEEAARRFNLATEQAGLDGIERRHRTARLANLVLPAGWLPLGVADAAAGDIKPALLGTLGMTLIGAASLWRAYRATVGQYQGQSTNRRAGPAPAAPAAAVGQERGVLLLEARLPGLSEPVSAIALGNLRSLLRAPESKMMLLTPVILTPIFGSMLWQRRHDIPELARPLVAISGMLLLLQGMLPLTSNQFGFDRDGFRAFVLCSAPRRDILLGKNLGFAPLPLGLALILIAFVQVFCPMRLDHLLAMVPQTISMFLLTCLVTNLLSIYAPGPIAPGSLKVSNPKFTTVLLQLGMIFVLLPLTLAPTLLPLGLEVLFRFLDWSAAVPVFLVLALAESMIVIILYRWALRWQGLALQGREQRILDTVTNRAP